MKRAERGASGLDVLAEAHAANMANAANAPLPLLPDTPLPTPFPLDALPPLMRQATEAIAEHVKAPLPLAGFSVLAAATHLAQTRVNAPHLHHVEGMPSSLFLLALGESGDRKSECSRLAFKPIDEAEKTARTAHAATLRDFEAERAKHKRKAGIGFEEAHQAPSDPRTIFSSDASFSKITALFVQGMSYASWSTDEGAQFFGAHNMRPETCAATLGGMVKLFDTGHVERDRASNNLDGSGFAYHRRLSMFLMAQPVAVARSLNDPLLRGQGFLPRFLFAAPDSLAGTRQTTAEELSRSAWADWRLQAFWGRCEDIMASAPCIADEGGVVPPVIPLDDGAQRVWLEFYNQCESEQGPLQMFDALKPFAGRAGELARRVAAVLACFEGEPTITAEGMTQATRLVRYSLEEWARYSGCARIDPTLRMAADLMRWLRHPKRARGWQSFTRDRLGKSGPPAVRPARIRDAVVSLLLEKRHLRATPDGKTLFVALPPADSAETAENPVGPGFSAAEHLRGAADSRPHFTPLAKNPQPSAILRKPTTPIAAASPQHPQIPQHAPPQSELGAPMPLPMPRQRV